MEMTLEEVEQIIRDCHTRTQNNRHLIDICNNVISNDINVDNSLNKKTKKLKRHARDFHTKTKNNLINSRNDMTGISNYLVQLSHDNIDDKLIIDRMLDTIKNILDIVNDSLNSIEETKIN